MHGDSDGDARSTAEVLTSLVVNTQALIAREVELLGLEVRRLAAEKFVGAVQVVSAAVAGIVVLALAAVAVAIAIEPLLPARWMAWAIVALGTALISWLVLLLGLRRLARSWLPRRTLGSLEETAGWAQRTVLGADDDADTDGSRAHGAGR
jgi:hypothetical protein